MSKGRWCPIVSSILAMLLAAAILHSGGIAVRNSFAQNTGSQSGGSSITPSDDLQRSARLDNYSLTADHGLARGEDIYFYKCWMCHNKYAQSAPYLRDLYQHSTLVSGKAVSDASVAEHIKAGSAAMPAFGTTLSDSEIADLVMYIRSGQCCVEGENPPRNPWYRAATNRLTVQNTLSGGAHGMVRIASGETSEGIGVQLVAPNGVRTTVYTNIDGRYEFPAMQAGAYILRIPTPREFKPYRRDSVAVDGATSRAQFKKKQLSKGTVLLVTVGNRYSRTAMTNTAGD
jgi:cytochrome c5